MRGRLILSLCDFTGNWAQPYADAGYEVRRIDLKVETPAWIRCNCCENYWCRIHAKHAHDCTCPEIQEWKQSPYLHGMPGQDVRLLELPREPVHGIFAAPPCTVFASSGARWKRTPEQMGEGLSIVDACLRLVLICRPVWWALENPAGILHRWIGPPAFRFHPWQYGDAYTKLTCLWGSFTPPLPLFATQTPVEPARVCAQGSWIQSLGGKSERTKELRSATPPGFARAFFQANP